MKMKELCLDVVGYMLIAVVLFATAHEWWKTGKQGLAIVSFIAAVFSVWEAIENYNDHCTKKHI